MKSFAFGLAVFGFVLAGPIEAEEIGPDTPLPDREAEAPALTEADGLERWERIHAVFSHPRCANCHVDAGGVPIWSGPSYGPEPRAHGMYVHGGESRIGVETVPCGTCHMPVNSPLPHGPPGAEIWFLPPPEFQWFGKTSAEICNQVKDPATNGDRSLYDIAHHVGHDALVLWGWDPGPGREPAPYSAQETALAILKWAAAGAPCPAS